MLLAVLAVIDDHRVGAEDVDQQPDLAERVARAQHLRQLVGRRAAAAGGAAAERAEVDWVLGLAPAPACRRRCERESPMGVAVTPEGVRREEGTCSASNY